MWTDIKIRYFVIFRSKTNHSDKYDENYMKVKFNSSDDCFEKNARTS